MRTTPPLPRFTAYSGSPYIIDLSAHSAATRWAEVIAAETYTARRLFQSAWQQFPALAREHAEWFGQLYRDLGGLYQDELEAWATAVNLEFGAVAMVNCAYEFNQLAATASFTEIGATLLQKIFGCSAAVVATRDGAMAHLRNLDWPIPGMGSATRLFEFRRGHHRFLTVGFPMFLGVLTGMVPGAYSVSINWAPPQQAPSFDLGPSFLLRETLSDCRTYDEAVARLRTTRLNTSVFYTVCGAQSSEGCIIERTPTDAFVRPLAPSATGGVIVQTNHHDPAGKFAANNRKLDQLKADDYLVETTVTRRAALEAALAPLTAEPAASDSVFLAALAIPQVTNHETCQRVLFRPTDGTLLLDTAMSE